MVVLIHVLLQVIEKEEIGQDSSATEQEQDQFGLASQIKAINVIHHRL